MSQSLTHQHSQPPAEFQEMHFWLEKVVVWGQADSPVAHKDTCLYLSRLRGFLQRLLTHINNMSSTTETMRTLPSLGQLLGRLCWNPLVTADDTSRGLIFQCLWGLYSENPSNALERKANQWIRSVLCQLATEEDETARQTLMRHVCVPPTKYHLKVLTKIVVQLQENSGKSCKFWGDINQRCSCDNILAISEACVALVSCAEATPLIGALLQRPVTCARAALGTDFLDAVSSAYSSHCLSLEDQAVISLWCHSLSSLEEAVLGLLESVLANTESSPQKLEQQIVESLLPKACAQHCSIFLVVNDIFRFILKKQEESVCVQALIQTFTSCFVRELKLLQPQMCVSIKAFFPQSPQNLLLPLLTQPPEMPEEAWRRHLNWLSGSLQRLTEEEEERDGSRLDREGHHEVFEAWFLLVQCGHWVQVAVQLLTTTQPEDCHPLLWLLTFYHHPTNRGHHRPLQLVRAKDAWDHLRLPLSDSACSLPAERLQNLAVLLLSHTQQPSVSPLLILHLLVNSAVFCQRTLSDSKEMLQMVVGQFGLVSEAVHVLGSLERRLNAGSCLLSDANRVRLRIEALLKGLTHMGAPQSPAEHPTHIHTYTHTHKTGETAESLTHT
ncbi:Fanconi anemia group C protein [Aulostomus maculatus]